MTKEAKDMTRDDIVKAQAKYKGNDAHKLVKIEFTENSKYYKVGQVDEVHPATVALFKAKGLQFKILTPGDIYAKDADNQ